MWNEVVWAMLLTHQHSTRHRPLRSAASTLLETSHEHNLCLTPQHHHHHTTSTSLHCSSFPSLSTTWIYSVKSEFLSPGYVWNFLDKLAIMNTCYLLSWGEEGRVYLSCWPGSAIVAVLQDGDSATSLTSGTDCCCCCWCSRCRYLYSNDKKGKDTYPVLLLWRHGPNCASFPLCSIDVSAVDSTGLHCMSSLPVSSII